MEQEESGHNDITEEKEGVPTLPQLFVALGILLLVFGSSYIPALKDSQKTQPQTELERSVRNSLDANEVARSNPFDTIQVDATAAYVWDVTKQRALYNKNASSQLPLASLTKLMTAVVVNETFKKGDTVEITLEAIRQEGESGFLDGEIWDVGELLDLTLVSSSNDGAYALAAAAGAALSPLDDPTEIFVKAMNSKAEQLGLSQTYFTNPTGLDATEAQSGSYGSARDMAFLMEHIIKTSPAFMEHTTEPEITVQDTDGIAHTASNTNPTVDSVPGLLGSKTGYTVLAGGNLVIAYNAGLNRPVIISVLGSTPEGRFDDVLKLTKASQEYILNN